MIRSTPHTLLDATVEDCASALIASLDRLSTAAKNANDLLLQAGFAGAKGDTADDLHVALAQHSHLLHQFQVKIRTSEHIDVFTLAAESSFSAYSAAAASHGSTPCGITVTPTEPDRLTLAAAHRTLQINQPLDAALDNPSLGLALRSYARKHPVRRSTTTDFKSLAANDRD